MEYRRLGKSGLKVSEIGLGTNSFGSRTDERVSIGIVEHALELGINFIDTADLYGRGRSEEIIGKALAGKRSRVVLATKVGHPGTLRPQECGSSRHHIMRGIEASLRRLNTDYIDLYYIHFPDPETPIAETLRALDDLVRAGKVRYIGCSNFDAWRICEAVWTAKLGNLESFVALESRYNLLDRSLEREVSPCCENYGIGVVPWGPLASGFLTGKYRGGVESLKGTRLENPAPIYRDILTEAGFEKVAKLETFARERGYNVTELAVAWLLSHSWLSSVIAGATSTDQVSQNAAGAGWRLNAEDIARLNTII
ncbi:MAG: aldo/keto reductase [Chloroflexi bacterium]|nr:aldo/keto reductase [Chloroflexota bacterium]